uniref:Glycoside hydrolase family 30 protein n=1 Tax=Mycena chlorophos TaxID=658473 RepID=A0ABQ0MCS3_MYCCL|nr:glycoside hydrolase family 30 protein [Mycena chlorophos]
MTNLFSSIGPNPPINFTTPGAAGSVDIVVTETNVYQTMNGFGGSLTDSSALTLSQLKAKNSNNYWAVLTYLFDVTDGANAAGFSYVRVPIGASDFSAKDPTYLLKAVQGFQAKGIPIFAISVQNEPENSNPTYPTCTWTPAQEGQVGAALRTLLNNNGLSSVKLIGYEVTRAVPPFRTSIKAPVAQLE